MWIKIKSQWGFALFLFISLLSTVTLMSRPVGGHWGIFTSAALAILERGDPYGTTFGWGVGPYYYSLNCGLLFFGPFAMLPLFWGLLLFIIVSWTVFVAGLFSLDRSLETHFGFSIRTMPYRHLFWLMLASEMTGGILSSKIEVIMVGAMFFALKFLIEGRSLFAGFLLGWITDWKFQPLPIIGLVAFVLLLAKDWRALGRFLGGVLVALLVAQLIPTLWYGWEPALALYSRQREVLMTFLEGHWLGFQHVYAFAVKGLGIEFGYETVKRISVVGGLILLGVLIVAWKRAAPAKKLEHQPWLIFSFGLGAAYMNMFSPASQSNAYILHAPLVLGLFYFASSGSFFKTRAYLISLLAGYFFVSLAYSDLNPAPLRRYMFSHSYKPVGIAVLLVAMCYAFFSWSQRGARRE